MRWEKEKAVVEIVEANDASKGDVWYIRVYDVEGKEIGSHPEAGHPPEFANTIKKTDAKGLEDMQKRVVEWAELNGYIRVD